MSNCSLIQDQIANYALAINRISDSLPYFDVVERWLSGVKGQQIQIRTLELLHVQVGILAQRFDCVRRETGSQRRDIHSTALQFGLHRVRFTDNANTKRRYFRRAIPISLIGFKVDDLLYLIIALELKRSSS